jgi:hypothetical protein
MKTTLIYFSCLALMVCSSCHFTEDVEPEVKIELSYVLGETDTPGTVFHLMYSLDGKTFSAEKPVIQKKGMKLFVKVNDGTEDITSADYIFDWSDSKPLPSLVDGDLAEFTANVDYMTVGVLVAKR